MFAYQPKKVKKSSVIRLSDQVDFGHLFMQFCGRVDNVAWLLSYMKRSHKTTWTSIHRHIANLEMVKDIGEDRGFSMPRYI